MFICLTAGVGTKRRHRSTRSTIPHSSSSEDAWIHTPAINGKGMWYTCHHCSTTPSALIPVAPKHVKHLERSIHKLNIFFGLIVKIVKFWSQMLVICIIFGLFGHY
jgi:hypothetical protein